MAVNFAIESPWVTALPHDMLNRAKQHTPCAAGRVVDALTLLRIENLNHHADDAAWRVELAGLVAPCHVREFSNEIFVGVAQNVGTDCGITEVDT